MTSQAQNVACQGSRGFSQLCAKVSDSLSKRKLSVIAEDEVIAHSSPKKQRFDVVRRHKSFPL
ncbi:hypothetical protein BGZ49_006664, partial [Haplosporangium sp. Z 27]